MTNKQQQKWQFWIDRGGTFTDIVALSPENKILTHKLLSENPEHYESAPIEGIKVIMNIPQGQPLPTEKIEVIKMGTTVATNALLEKKGEGVVLVINRGFKDSLRIGYQHRPDIFARNIILPEMLYKEVIDVSGRFCATGKELQPLNLLEVEQDLQRVYNQGIRSCAIVLLHSYRYHDHELQISSIARKIGFTQVSVSHQISNLIKLVSRGDTTVVDAYLSPVLKDYVNQVKANLQTTENKALPTLMFIQSNGGLVDSKHFQGKDSILSGPAGGIVGAVKICEKAGYKKIITFDMGGTSTDVAHYAGEFERSCETEVAGVRICTPMMAIHTVAAGGGSICYFDGSRYRVGPQSAGANPGPACYGKGGSLTITDCNVLLGKIQPNFFPKIFGRNADKILDVDIVKEKFNELQKNINNNINIEDIAQGFLTIAIEKMANAIKKVSLQKGYDVSEYALCCFGGAGAQHACLIAEKLGIKTIIIHPLAGVLSAYGIGMADIRIIKEKTLNTVYKEIGIEICKVEYSYLENIAKQELKQQIEIDNKIIQIKQKIYLKYQGTDSSIEINFSNYETILAEFNHLHQQQYGFILPDKSLVIDKISIEVIYPTYEEKESKFYQQIDNDSSPITTVKIYSKNQWYNTPIYQRENIGINQKINAPALIVESTGTNIIEIGWQGKIDREGNLVLTKINHKYSSLITENNNSQPNPILLEIFNNLFRFIAEEMGITLQNTSYSVNIKERLDFSCAIFDQKGELVANAPHIPVHLGSMSESVKALIKDSKITLKKDDLYLTNNPYNGGTHLPDITAISPIFYKNNSNPDFYVASRGHHADIGGISPGSMPPNSTNIKEEGILIDNFCLIKEGIFQEKALENLLIYNPYPVKNFTQNLGDLKAQVAANKKGIQELINLTNIYGLNTVKNYMQFVQKNAELCVKKAIQSLQNGEFITELDNGAKIKAKITINQNNSTASIDFTGTSAQLDNNFNAPLAVTKAAVLYVFRTLVDDDIPLNAGCLKPLNLIIPEGCMLNPQYPCAVVAGNVETSQNIVDCLYGALGIMANSQGTMNNFTFGNIKYQYYETICGGSGAGYNHHGTDAVQTHMTNSRLTDPEVLEDRFPVRLEHFGVRKGSGGEGRYKGGNGVIRAIRFLEPMTAGILSNRRIIFPQGLKGGKEGKKGENYIIKKDGRKLNLPSNATVEMNVDDVFVIKTPGGGGFF
ncbi:hydantoinase B/oxoprolinase family protein [Geminocystis sp. NIES-3709]|uniref:hydantoinase B/oxoprolinase family protein n=1 Tax=Geminocystis sp. NIES-3709 TaxID=1617448 RepID=UPI0005FCC705|nr:hydantoinase B/oxoprolinase family protein [Geminocystis sp. NIES-3709]BAQ66333.1 5-oxoprolinase [Geminocystis sp. NIES-3709]